MKKNVLAAIIAAAAMAAAFAGCNPGTDKPKPTEVAATENAEAAATETTEPVTTESIENTDKTVEPTEESKYAVLDFNECAEEVLRLTPCKDESEKLPEEGADDMVLYIQADGTQFGPAWFATNGETIAVYDIAHRLITYNNGKLNHFEKKYLSRDGYACMSGNTVYTLEETIDISNGDINSNLLMPDDLYFVVMNGFFDEDGVTPSCCYSLGNDTAEQENDLIKFRLMTLREKTKWVDKEEAFIREEAYNGDMTTFTFPHGSKWTIDRCGSELIGKDANGYYYFDFIGEKDSVYKIDSSGNIISMLEIPFTSDELWAPIYNFNLLPDGTVYVAAAMNDAYVIWKINM